MLLAPESAENPAGRFDWSPIPLARFVGGVEPEFSAEEGGKRSIGYHISPVENQR